MYLLDYLASHDDSLDERSPELPGDCVEIEYRLACSGEFYRRFAKQGPWRRDEMSRLLSRRPFELFVVSRPFNSFPQELCLRFRMRTVYVDQAGGGRVGSLPPYEELVGDICAVLTLLSRRLVSPVLLVSLRNGVGGTCRDDSFSWNYPSPILILADHHRADLRTSVGFDTENGWRWELHEPPAVEVDSNALTSFLLLLPGSQHASAILQAARAYSSALDHLRSRPEISYQLLISATETLAQAVLGEYRPDHSEMVNRAGDVCRLAQEFGLRPAQAEELAVTACSRERWIGSKFRRFLMDYSTDAIWTPDRVFPIHPTWEPTQEDFKKTLVAIYGHRSKYLHEGAQLPSTISQGRVITSPGFPPPREISTKDYMPPVHWFERVVSSAARNLIFKELGDSTSAFHDVEVDAES